MSSVLHQTLIFENMTPGEVRAMPHAINYNGVAQIPEICARDMATFEITSIDAAEVTLTNKGSSTTDCNVWLWLRHSIERTDALLSPQPFVIGGAVVPPTWAVGGSYAYEIDDEASVDDLSFDEQIGSKQVFYLSVETAPTIITGLDASYVSGDGAMVTIFYANPNTLDVTFADEDNGSNAENRFALPANTDVVLSTTNNQITFRYDGTLERWTLFSLAA